MRSARESTLFLGWMVAVVLICMSCVSNPRPLTGGQREAIQRRAETWFTHAVLLKPGEPVSTNDLGFRLSPLIVQEIATMDTVALPQAAPLILLFTEGRARVAGQPRQQLSFVWQQPVAGSRGAETPSVWQGLRLTLSAAGQPAIWEVLHDRSGAEVVFVSQSIETAALRAFGRPLPGRRFAIERAVGETPDVVVARVIDDGPVLMGPIVHLDTRGDITTANCRCMTTQVRQLVGQGGYGLVSDASAGEFWSRSRSSSASGRQLDRILRWPAGF